MNPLSGFVNKIGERLADLLINKLGIKWLLTMFFGAWIMGLAGYSYLNWATISQSKNYILIASPSTHSDIEQLLKLYPKVKTLTEKWENLNNNAPDSEDARYLNKNLKNLLQAFSRIDSIKLKEYPNFYVFFVGNFAIVNTIAAIHFDDITKVAEAEKHFDLLQQARIHKISATLMVAW